MREEMMSRLAEAVKEAIGTKCTVHFINIEKNNGLVLQSVEIMEPGMNAVPVIYIDSLLEGVENGWISLLDAARDIADIYRGVKDIYNPGIQDVVSSINKEYVLERVVYQMVNKEKNAGRLADMPYKKLLDLAAVYRVVIDSTDGYTSMAVNRELCNQFRITEDELDIAASRNMKKAGFCVKSMASVMAEMAGMPEETFGLDMGIWVITSPAMINGAAAMLFPCCFCGLAEQLGSDLYILPSSIHEVIAVPTENMGPNQLRDIVCAVNASEVASDEVLSDNVYRYSYKDDTLTIA